MTAGPCQRTMQWLRAQGYTVDKVEQRLPRGRTTRDFLGFADVLALHPDHQGVLAVQTTTAAHLAEREKKVAQEPRADLWRQCGNRLWLVGWSLRGDRGERKRWVPTVWDVTKEPREVSTP